MSVPDNMKPKPGLNEFAVRRTRLDAQAATHRLHLIGHSDPRPIARTTRLAGFFILSGLSVPSCPGPWVRHWLKAKLPGSARI